MNKFGLIHLGNDESYGLVFAAGELIKRGHNIKWFDGESGDVIQKIVDWCPDFVFFSPLTTFFNQALTLSKEIKRNLPGVRSVFGGHHVFALPNCINLDGVDIIVKGSVYGTVDKIINSPGKEIINGVLIPVEDMIPSREEYYKSIPRIANRERKYIMSHFGCMYNCSYCSISRVRRFYTPKIYVNYLIRRPIKNLIDEARIFLEYPTKEVSLEDDDILSGPGIEEWLEDFLQAWKTEIGLPTYANVTPITVNRVSDKTLKILSELVDSVQMGVQTARKESLKLFNRYQDEEMVENAYNRLKSFGIPVKLEFIIGLPVDDPIGDAIDSIKMAQRIGAGTFVTFFPLMLYAGTDLELKCRQENIPLNEDCTMEWHTGIGSVKFDSLTNKRIRNLTKMATMFVKYNVSEIWIRALMDMDITEHASKELSKCQYLESLIFRMGKNIEKDFDEILANMKFKY